MNGRSHLDLSREQERDGITRRDFVARLTVVGAGLTMGARSCATPGKASGSPSRASSRERGWGGVSAWRDVSVVSPPLYAKDVFPTSGSSPSHDGGEPPYERKKERRYLRRSRYPAGQKVKLTRFWIGEASDRGGLEVARIRSDGSKLLDGRSAEVNTQRETAVVSTSSAYQRVL